MLRDKVSMQSSHGYIATW